MCFCQQKENVSFRPDLIAAMRESRILKIGYGSRPHEEFQENCAVARRFGAPVVAILAYDIRFLSPSAAVLQPAGAKLV